MISKNITGYFSLGIPLGIPLGTPLIIVLLLLSGCLGQEENSAQSGLTVHVAEVHVEAQTATAAKASVDALVQKAAVAGSYDRANLEHHDIHDGAGHLLSLYRAYLVVDEIELVKCASVAALPRMLLNAIIPTAEAHAGHGSEPVGGRNLDKPNVIDIVTQDEYYLALGDVAVAPGDYCAMRVSLARLSGEAYGEPEVVAASTDEPTTVPGVPDLTGMIFSIRADYCAADDGAGNCLQHAKVDIDEYGFATPTVKTIAFSQPLVVAATRREAFVAFGIAYGEWVENIDVSLLPGDAGERQKLLDNIVGSLHVYAKGFGDLPINVTP